MIDDILETKVYEKTHNVTGKKYVGISTRDTDKYVGSGTAWKEHLEEHGYDISTEILYTSESQSDLTEFCDAYSKEKNIVESDEYMNIVAERGGCLGGDANPNYKDGRWVGRHDDKELERLAKQPVDEIKYERDKDLFTKSQMNARYHKSKKNKQRAKEYFDKWQSGIRGTDPNGKSLQKTDTFEFWYQCEGTMSWQKREAFYGGDS
jgi:hypothetical protein